MKRGTGMKGRVKKTPYARQMGKEEACGTSSPAVPGKVVLVIQTFIATCAWAAFAGGLHF
jgi:hypothetical protein